MFIQNLRAKVGARLNGDKEAGFTLIELLVVMLILGILAAIAIPAFFNQRDKGSDAQAKAAARTAQTAIETYATDHAGSYEGANPEALKKIEDTLQTSGANAIEVTSTAKTYTVSSTSSTGNKFSISRGEGGVVDFDCTTQGEGGCPTGGDWNK